MPVEVPGEDALERTVGERERQRVGADDPGRGHAFGRDPEHALALIQAGDRAAQVPGKESGAACHIECCHSRQRSDRIAQRRHLLVPARPFACGEQPRARVPLVVLGGTAVVVLAHYCWDSASPMRASSWLAWYRQTASAVS